MSQENVEAMGRGYERFVAAVVFPSRFDV